MLKASATAMTLLVLALTITEIASADTKPSPAPIAMPADSAADKKSALPAEGTPAVVVDDNSVESLLGKVVTGAANEKLGQITDILVGHSGDVRAAVIDFGGFLGVGTRKVAVAWTTLRFSPESIVLDMTRDELRVTPVYREGEPVVIIGATAGQSSASSAARAQPPK